MELSIDEIQKRIKAPKNRNNIQLAVYQEERLLLHCESILEKYNLPFNAMRNFTNWYQSLITQEKYLRVDELMRTPLSTVAISKTISKKLNKYLDAQDRYIDFKFTDPNYNEDYIRYLKESNDEEFWTQDAPTALMTEICSIVVIDLPKTQESKRPEPYKYIVSPRNFVDIEINKFTKKVEYFIFRQSDFTWDDSLPNQGLNTNQRLQSFSAGDEMQKIIAIDDCCYRIFVRKAKPGQIYNEQNTTEDFTLAFEARHDLGYTPCIDFWQQAIKGTNGINKLGVITPMLAKLDYYLFYRALVDYADLYGAFPIMVMYDTEEEQFDSKTKEYNFGEAFNQEQTSPISNVNQTQNPKTTKRRFVGAGSVIDVPVPASGDDWDAMKNMPVKFVSMDVENLKLLKEKIDEYEDEIVEFCTGENKDYLNEIAKNEEMQNASYSERETILTIIKRNIERVHHFCTKCQAELRYGKEFFISATIDYGSDFFLKDSSALTKEYSAATEAGMPQGYSGSIVQSAINTRFRNNIDQFSRVKILYDLEPYPNLTFQQIFDLQINISDEENFIIKANFIEFIGMFEREVNTSICNFGSLIEYSKKISIIKSKLKEYGGAIKWRTVDASTGIPLGGKP